VRQRTVAIRNLGLTARLRSAPGIKFVNQGDLVAVLHTRPGGGRQCMGKIKAVWKAAATNVDPGSIHAHLVANAAPMKDMANAAETSTSEDKRRSCV